MEQGHIILCEIIYKFFFFSFKGWLPEPKGWTISTKCTINERPVQKGGWVSHSPTNTAGEHHDVSQSKHEQLWGDGTFTLERREFVHQTFEDGFAFHDKTQNLLWSESGDFQHRFSQINRGCGEAKALGNSSKGFSNPSFRNTQLAKVNFPFRRKAEMDFREDPWIPEKPEGRPCNKVVLWI